MQEMYYTINLSYLWLPYFLLLQEIDLVGIKSSIKGKSFSFITKMKKRDDVRRVIHWMVLFQIEFFVLLLAHSTIFEQFLGSKLMKN